MAFRSSVFLYFIVNKIKLKYTNLLLNFPSHILGG